MEVFSTPFKLARVSFVYEGKKFNTLIIAIDFLLGTNPVGKSSLGSSLTF